MVQKRIQGAEVPWSADLSFNAKVIASYQPGDIAVCARSIGLDGPALIRVDHLAMLIMTEINAPIRQLVVHACFQLL
jgi:hypothetical protein